MGITIHPPRDSYLEVTCTKCNKHLFTVNIHNVIYTDRRDIDNEATIVICPACKYRINIVDAN